MNLNFIRRAGSKYHHSPSMDEDRGSGNGLRKAGFLIDIVHLRSGSRMKDKCSESWTMVVSACPTEFAEQNIHKDKHGHAPLAFRD